MQDRGDGVTERTLNSIKRFPNPKSNRSVVQFGGRDAGTFSSMTAVRSETSEYPDLKI
jgi:hypothetical protein